MRAKKTNDDLDTQDINLLPEEMRAVEDKARRSSRGSERVYQLREPKKERRRRVFAWLPIFGGMHWGATSEPKKEIEAAHAPQAREQGQPQPTVTPQETGQPLASRTSDEFGVIRPILESAPEETVRDAKGVGRKGAGIPSFLGLFSRRKPRPPIERHRETPVVPRHYSLLSEKQPSAPKPMQQPPPPPPDIVPPIPTVSSLEAARVSVPAKLPKTARQKKLWLKSIFTAFFGFFSKGGGRGPHVLKMPKHIAREKGAHEPARRTPLPESRASVRATESIKPMPSVTPAISPRFERVPPRPQRRPMRPEKRAGALLPRWLDIFYWFGLFFRRNGVRVRVRPQILKPDAAWERASMGSDIRAQAAPQEVVEQKIQRSEPAMPVIQTRQQAPPLQAPFPTTPQTPLPPPKTPAKPIEAAAKPPKPPKKGFRGLGFHFPRRQQVPEALRNLQEVNLIPAELNLRSFRQISRLILFSVLACVGFMAIIYGALSLWKYQVETRTAEIDQQIEGFKTNLIVYNTKEPEMSVIGAKVSLINSLLSRHIYWTNFFALLEKYTLPDVYYDGVSAATNGSLSLSAHGSSFETVSRLLQLLGSSVAKEFVRKASVTSAQLVSNSAQQSQVDFTLELTLNPSLFYYATSTP